MAITHIPNETGNQVAYFATETIPGTGVTPTAQLLGTFTSNKNRPIRRREEMTGGYDRYVSPSRERATFDGTYTEDLTYETLPSLMRYAVTGGGTGTSDSETIPGYTYAKSPSFDTDDVDTMTVEYGVDGRGFRSTGVRFNEFTISADHTSTDDVWAFSGPIMLRDKVRLTGDFDGVATGGSTSTIVQASAAWTINAHTGKYVYQDYGTHIGEVRRIASNTADTLTLESPVLSSAAVAGDIFHIAGAFPVISVPEYERITAEGTDVFLDVYDPDTSTLGTTNVSDRIVSWNVTQTLTLTPKYRASGQLARYGRGARWITGTLRFEADRWDEYREWEDDTLLSIRIEKEGSVIDPDAGPATNKLARIDVEKAIWDVPTDDVDQNNLTLSLTFVAILVPGDPILTVSAINQLATLP